MVRQDKSGKQKTENRNLKKAVIIIASFSCALFIAMYAGILFLNQSVMPEAEKKSGSSYDVQTVRKETKKNEASEKRETDTREAFTVLEIVPHEVCSIFPYLVEWGSKEAYDANVPIGYETLIKYTETGSGIGIASPEGAKASASLPYTSIKEAEKRDTMLSYDTEIRADGSYPEGNWYKVKTDEDRKENGYFEYVGLGKGLYDLSGYGGSNFNSTATAVSKGTGKYALSDFAFFVKHGSEGSVYDKPVPGTWNRVKAYTDNNYNLKFVYGGGTGGTNGKDYVIDSIVNNVKGDYRAGNIAYKGTSATEKRYKVIKATANTGGRYVRILDSSQNDGYFTEAAKAGYFKLYGGTGSGERYDLHFETGPGGVYDIADFEYAPGDGGDFDISFRYVAPGTGDYKVTVLELKDQKGEYSAVTTSAQGNSRVPVFKRQDGGDYGMIIDSVDVVSYNEGNNKCWVWVSVTDEDTMQKTGLDEYQAADGSFILPTELKARLYVRNQDRKYSYYARNGFKNNEWLKLRCIFEDSDNPENPYPLNEDNTALQNLADAKKDLDAYDANYRIDIVTKEPSAVTVADVNNADLIYLSDEPGFLGLETYWKEHGNLVYPKYSETGSGGASDLSFEAVQNIWYRCVYKNEASLMVNVSVGEVNQIRRNTAKLMFMMNFFNDPAMFIKFLGAAPNDGRYNPEMTEVLSDGTARHSEGARNEFFNRKTLPILQGLGYKDNTTWQDSYFIVWEDPGGDPEDEPWKLVPTTQDSAYANNRYNWNQVYKDEPRETYMITANYNNKWFASRSNMNKIFEILHGRKQDDLKIVVTNAALMDSGEMVIYEDELSERFDIFYKVTSKKSGNVTVKAEFNDGFGSETIASGLSVPINSETVPPIDVKGGFSPTVRKRRVVITADNGTKTVKAEVFVVVRDLFTLD